MLDTYEFESFEFDDYYQDVLDDLEWTAYDSIITKNTALRIFQGLEELKSAELRLAVIDRYRSDGKTTCNMIETTYPGYLLSINDEGVNDQDFDQGDIIKRAARKAYLINNGVIRVPTVITEFSGNNSATSVILNGYVIENGGTDAMSRGIAWAIFYNPTSALTTFSFQVESPEYMVLTIVDLKGQVVYHDDLGSLPLGNNHVELDLTGLQNGLYSCQLTSNGKLEANCKLLVAH